MEETPWYKKPGIWIAAAFTLLAALFFGERKRGDKLEAQVESDKAKIQDAKLSEADMELQRRMADQQEKIDQLRRANPTAENMTPEEVKKYWDSKK